MMSDYNISMLKALLWDWEGFGADLRKSRRDGTLEQDFLFYLWQNNVFDSDIGNMAADVFLGRREDLVLKK